MNLSSMIFIAVVFFMILLFINCQKFYFIHFFYRNASIVFCAWILSFCFDLFFCFVLLCNYSWFVSFRFVFIHIHRKNICFFLLTFFYFFFLFCHVFLSLFSPSNLVFFTYFSFLNTVFHFFVCSHVVIWWVLCMVIFFYFDFFYIDFLDIIIHPLLFFGCVCNILFCLLFSFEFVSFLNFFTTFFFLYFG